MVHYLGPQVVPMCCALLLPVKSDVVAMLRVAHACLRECVRVWWLCSFSCANNACTAGVRNPINHLLLVHPQQRQRAPSSRGGSPFAYACMSTRCAQTPTRELVDPQCWIHTHHTQHILTPRAFMWPCVDLRPLKVRSPPVR